MMGWMMATALLALMSAVCSGYVCWRVARRERTAARERTAEKAMQDAAAEEEERRSREMAEGFDNLMRFGVNGQDGFGGAL